MQRQFLPAELQPAATATGMAARKPQLIHLASTVRIDSCVNGYGMHLCIVYSAVSVSVYV